MTVGNVLSELFGDADRRRDELLATSTADLERLKAKNEVALQQISVSEARLDIGSFIQEGLQAIASITAEDVVRHAQRVVSESERKKDKDPGEILLALIAIWLWGDQRANRPAPSPAPPIESPSQMVKPELAGEEIAFLRWFASLSPNAQSTLLAGFGLLAQTPTELEVLGIWSPPNGTGAHLGFILAFVTFSFALAAARRE